MYEKIFQIETKENKNGNGRGEKMHNKKYQVFISLTYADLLEAGKKILDMLFIADCIPAGNYGIEK